MVKRLFEYIALSILAVLGLAKLKGKKVNPLALRVLLSILSFVAYCLNSTLVLLFAGTWFLFLILGDIGRRFGLNLDLFIPVPVENAASSSTTSYLEADDSNDSQVAGSVTSEFMKKCASCIKSFLPSGKVK